MALQTEPIPQQLNARQTEVIPVHRQQRPKPPASRAVSPPTPSAPNDADRGVDGPHEPIRIVTLGVLLAVPVVAVCWLVWQGLQPHTAPTADAKPVASKPECLIDQRVGSGDTGEAVRCVQRRLVALGYLSTTPDGQYGPPTVDAVKRFQRDRELVADGIVGPRTGRMMGAWTAAPPDPASCPATGHGAVIDRFNQRAWLCDGNTITVVFPVTTATTQPAPGTYSVIERDLKASSDLTGKTSTMTHFVVFASGRYTAARVGFHSIPKYADGSYVQPLDSVGSPEQYGASSGCIRALPDDAVKIWDWLRYGDPVVVVS